MRSALHAGLPPSCHFPPGPCSSQRPVSRGTSSLLPAAPPQRSQPGPPLPVGVSKSSSVNHSPPALPPKTGQELSEGNPKMSCTQLRPRAHPGHKEQGPCSGTDGAAHAALRPVFCSQLCPRCCRVLARSPCSGESQLPEAQVPPWLHTPPEHGPKAGAAGRAPRSWHQAAGLEAQCCGPASSWRRSATRLHRNVVQGAEPAAPFPEPPWQSHRFPGNPNKCLSHLGAGSAFPLPAYGCKRTESPGGGTGGRCPPGPGDLAPRPCQKPPPRDPSQGAAQPLRGQHLGLRVLHEEEG